MAITITIERDPKSQELSLELESLGKPEPDLLQVAVAVLQEMHLRLTHSTNCPVCQPEAEVDAKH